VSTTANPLPKPHRGEIWYVKLPTDPPDKLPRPVVVVSIESRNQNDRANSVQVVPLTTTLSGVPTHIRLQPGETGLNETSEVQAEDITVVRKEHLQAARAQLRRLSETQLRKIAKCVVMALGFLPEDMCD
jgi:mRNA interferase MazF